MIYKFVDALDSSIEIYQSDAKEVTIDLSTADKSLHFYLDMDDLYNLIGCLHSMQKKIKEGGKNG